MSKKTERDSQWLSFATGMVLGCQELERARDIVLKILKWAEHEIDEEALDRFNTHFQTTHLTP